MKATSCSEASEDKGVTGVRISSSASGIPPVARSPPVNAGPQINTRARDYSPRISGDGQWLYFTSERGFIEKSQDQALSYHLLTQGLATVTNGLGNLNRVPLSPVLAAARKRSVIQSQIRNRYGWAGIGPNPHFP